jgi:hypothetical protein
MDWIIDDDEIEARAKELAELTGETVEDAVGNAVREQLEFVRAKLAAEKLAAKKLAAKRKDRRKLTPP